MNVLQQVRIESSRPGKSTANACIKSFNGTFRRKCLNVQCCIALDEAKQRIAIGR
ncbi:integrase core domain-containing protein [Nitrospira sp. M1]